MEIFKHNPEAQESKNAMQHLDQTTEFGLLTFGHYYRGNPIYADLRLQNHEIYRGLEKANLFKWNQARDALMSVYGGGMSMNDFSLGFQMDEPKTPGSAENRMIVANLRFNLYSPTQMTEDSEGYECAATIGDGTYELKIPTQSVGREVPRAKGYFYGDFPSNRNTRDMEFIKELKLDEIQNLTALITQGLNENIRFEREYVTSVIKDLQDPERRAWKIKHQPYVLKSYDFTPYLTAEEIAIINRPPEAMTTHKRSSEYDNETDEERRIRLRPYRDDSNTLSDEDFKALLRGY